MSFEEPHCEHWLLFVPGNLGNLTKFRKVRSFFRAFDRFPDVQVFLVFQRFSSMDILAGTFWIVFRIVLVRVALLV